jgi:hypothetical protein
LAYLALAGNVGALFGGTASAACEHAEATLRDLSFRHFSSPRHTVHTSNYHNARPPYCD